MKYSLLTFLMTLLLAGIHGQTMLPRYPTPAETEQVRKGEIFRLPVNGIETPPSSTPRAMAEWEELQALHIAWSYYNDNGIRDILIEIVREAREECEVVIIVPSGQQSSAQNALTNAGVDWSSHVSFVQAPINSIWCRDYGGNSVYLNDVDSLVLVDWIYNRNRPADNVSPEAIAEFMDIPIYTTTAVPYDLVNTGGNFMSDGLGNAFCSKLVLDENGPDNEFGFSNHSEEDIDGIMQDFMGISRYVKMDPLPYDVIHHIDMHMKLLDEETLLVGQYPAGVADGPQIEANLQYVLDNFTNAFGKPYKVIRIPMPPHNGDYPDGSWNSPDYRTYTNGVFVNKKVLIPLYQQQYDTTAIRIWEEALPGYEIVGINCNDIIPYLGAIHCITKEIGVADPLWITHDQLEDITWDMPDGYPVVARIQHRSGVESATVYYSLDNGQNYAAIDMSLIDAEQHLWSVNIPEQPVGSTIYYYIHATAVSGKSINRPLPAPAGYWKFSVLSDLVGISQPLRELELGPVYPNPTGAITYVPVFALQSKRAVIEVHDATGKKAMTVFEGQLPIGASGYYFDANQLTPDSYLVVLRSGHETVSRQVIIE